MAIESDVAAHLLRDIHFCQQYALVDVRVGSFSPPCVCRVSDLTRHPITAEWQRCAPSGNQASQKGVARCHLRQHSNDRED